ncbi:ATP-binding protein [Streptosporangium sp. NPDC048047]|uniref:sensor histidine kinase n=1 Tax=Streptosporangium sp. NPDC048047 TaxID=3155748 RepID=UPI00342301A5
MALRHLVRGIAAETDYGTTAELVTLAVAGLEESLSRRVRESADSYHGFLLDLVREAQEEERRRIARELHDRIGHGLSVAHQQLALSEAYRASDAARASAKTGMVQQAIQETMENLRQLTSELHPQTPVKSLEKSLIGFLEEMEDDEVSIVLDLSGDESWAEPRVRDEAFLIVREALRNALAHGNPPMVLVRVNIAPHELSASVRDNGRGFDPGAVRGHGVGMTSMRERAELLGGQVVITSDPGQGCLVELFVPLKRRSRGRRDV